MHQLDRIQYIQESWGSVQAPVNVETYSTQFGLFLEDDEKSELEVVFCCQSHLRPSTTDPSVIPHSPSRIACDPGSPVAPLNTTDPPESPTTTTHHQPYHIRGCSKVMLNTPDKVQSFFSTERPHLAAVYVDQDNSFECIRITRQCFEQLIQSCTIMSALKDSILHVGYRDLELEVAPPCPRSNFLFSGQGVSSDLCGFEVVYGLRFVESNKRSYGRPWSLRQCVIYNKTHLDNGSSLWFFCHLPQPLRKLMDSSMDRLQQSVAIQSLDIHISLLAATVTMWRPFFVWITDKVERYAMKVSLASVGGEGTASLAKGNSMVELKQLENELLDALLAIKAARSTLAFLRTLASTMDHPGAIVATHLDSRCGKLVDHSLTVQMSQIDALIEQATTILQKVRGTFSVIRNFLDLSSGHSLEELALQSRHEGAEMAKLASIANRDAKAIKALSVIALVYLPITVILNFFSTAFVDSSTGSVRVLRGWWLVFAVSIPLTVMTLFAWIIWSCRPRLHSRRDRESNHAQVPQSSATQSSEAPSTIQETDTANMDKFF